MKTSLNLLLLLTVCLTSWSQNRLPISQVDIGYNQNFHGFDLIGSATNKVFIIAEDMHNRSVAPALTLKFLQFLYSHNGIRTLAIEGGTSTAYLINRYLDQPDTTLLREIARHTFFWSKEHFAYYQALAAWNSTLPLDKRIVFEAADIEIKQESVILAVNFVLSENSIPTSLPLLGQFRTIFKEKEAHRKQYLGLNMHYYYNRDRCSALVDQVLADLKINGRNYETFFGEQFDFFKTMMTDLQAHYVFDYRTNAKFKFRDDMMYDKLVDISKRRPEGFLQVVGGKHTQPGASSFRLRHDVTSPFKDRVVIMNLAGRKENGKYRGARVVTRLASQYPELFKHGANVLIQNDGSDALLTSTYFDYTLALPHNEEVQPFPNSYWGK
jgi:hypothetical protein